MKKESSKKLLTVAILFVVHERLFYYHERLIMEFDNSLYKKKLLNSYGRSVVAV